MRSLISHLAAGTTTTTAVGYVISPDYGWVLLVTAILAFELLLIGFIFTGKFRRQYFTQEFMESNFGAEHKAALGVDIQRGGAPDMGCGRYSDKLTYEQWYNFNNAQRVHLNFLEFAPTNFAILLIAGIYFPILSAAAGLAVIIARIMYSIGYVLKGPPGRMIGAFANDAAIILLFVLSIISSVYFIQGQQINGRLIQ